MSVEQPTAQYGQTLTVFSTLSSEMRERMSRVAGLTGCSTVVPTWFRIFFQRPSFSASLKIIPDPFYAKNVNVRVSPPDSNSIHPLTKPRPKSYVQMCRPPVYVVSFLHRHATSGTLRGVSFGGKELAWISEMRPH